jgi:hypothetical protein
MDITTPNITPHTSNLEDEDLHFVNFVATCPMFGDVDVLVNIVLTNVTDWGRCT